MERIEDLKLDDTELGKLLDAPPSLVSGFLEDYLREIPWYGSRFFWLSAFLVCAITAAASVIMGLNTDSEWIKKLFGVTFLISLAPGLLILSAMFASSINKAGLEAAHGAWIQKARRAANEGHLRSLAGKSITTTR